jgi:hypothetical protein
MEYGVNRVENHIEKKVDICYSAGKNDIKDSFTIIFFDAVFT